MSQTETLFRAREPVTTFAATASVPTPKQLPKAGITLRVVNLSLTDAAYVGVSDLQSATATLPADGSVMSCYAAPGCDFTVSIIGDQQKWVSAITAGSAVSLLFYIGSGS